MLTDAFIRGLLQRVPEIGLPLVMVFKRDADVREAMGMLQSMQRNHVLKIYERDVGVVLAMQMSGTYDYDENRRVHVYLSRSARPDLLVHMDRYVERVELATEHRLQSLQSRRLKRRTRAHDEIMDSWLSDEVRESIKDWGLSMTHELIEEDGFHMLEIVVRDGNEIVGEYRLDGWTGLVRHNGMWRIDIMVSPERLSWFMLRDIEDYLEDMTAAS